VTGRTVREAVLPAHALPTIRMRRVLLLSIVAGLLAPVAAFGAGADVVRDCTDNGRIDSSHPASDYQDALNNLPSDVDEYTECRDIISRARRSDAGSSGGGSSGGGGTGSFPGGSGSGGIGSDTGATPPSGAESGALDDATRAGGAVTPAGDPIVPGASGLAADRLTHSVPGALLAALILLGLGTLAAAVANARRRGVNLPTPAPLGRALDRVFPRRA